MPAVAVSCQAVKLCYLCLELASLQAFVPRQTGLFLCICLLRISFAHFGTTGFSTGQSFVHGLPQVLQVLTNTAPVEAGHVGDQNATHHILIRHAIDKQCCNTSIPVRIQVTEPL